MSKTSVLSHTAATKINQDNIAAKNAWGAKKRENLFINSVVGGGGSSGGVSYVTTKTRGSVDVQGSIIATGISSDLAMQGQGMFVVSDSDSGKKVFTRRGDFRIDEVGYWKNGAGQLLYGNQLDKNEKPIKNASIISSLSAVNFANVKGSPKATTTLSISMNFNSKQEALRGPGIEAIVNKTAKNSSAKITREDVLFTETVANAGSLKLGDRFTFTSTPPGLAKTIEYGGLAIATAPSSLNNIFGATKIGEKFAIGAGFNQVAEGSALKITLSNGSIYSFAVASNAQASNKTFNSIQTLADAINNTGALNAKIEPTNGNLYIATVNPDLGMEFTDANGGIFTSKLGLVDVPDLATAQVASPTLTQRFNNLMTLNMAVNTKPDDYSLKATIESGSLKITSLLASNKFTIDGSSMGIRAFNKGVQGDGTERGRAAIQITAPQHGLQTGDFVQMTGINGGVTTPDGIYAVGAINNDAFEIYHVSSTPGDAAGALPATIIATALVPAATASWQKIPGQTFAAASGTISASVVGGNALDDNARVTITAAAHGLAQGDVVYISGGGGYHVGPNDIKLPDGYYVVQGVPPAGTFEIKPYQVAIGGAIAANASLTYKKVGHVEAGAFNVFNNANGITTFNTTALFSVPAVPTNIVTLSIPNHNYNIGDELRFTGLAAGYTIDNLAVSNNINYKVTAITANSVNFEVAGAAVTAGAATVGTYSSAGANNLGPTFRVDNVSRLMEYFKIDYAAGEVLNETYNANDTDKSLSGNSKLSTTESFTYPLSLFDSLGENYNLKLIFAKLGKNEWAVEIAAEVDPLTGQFDIIEAGNDGQIKAGIITFDENGSFISAGNLNTAFTVTRRNGSAPSQVLIDWKNELSKVKSGTVTQYETNSAFNVELIQQDGQAAGNLVSLEVNAEGYILGIFDSGQSLKLFQIPIAVFSNANGLRPGANGTFVATKDSGELLLKGAKTGGAGEVLAGVLEASNIDVTEELLNLQDLSNDIRANARAASTATKNVQTILSELQS